jgi:hypothetical protein
MRVLSLLVAGFLFLSTIETWAGYWLAGRWFVSSRYASVSLQTVRNWLDRGIITRTTQQAKIFIQRHGKWIILTIGLSQVIREVEDIQSSTQYCYLPSSQRIYSGWSGWGTLVIDASGDNPSRFYEVRYSSPCRGGSSVYLPAVEIRQWMTFRGRYEWVPVATVPTSGTYTYTCNDRSRVEVTISLRVSGACPSDVTQPPPREVDWSQKRRVSVRVFPNPSDFIRDEVISQDPALRWLRDEYNRIARDNTIPLIPPDALGDLELPQVDWSISPDEAIDFPAERGSTREGSRESELDVSIPGFDTSLPSVDKKPFPIQLINSIINNHPLLRILQGIDLNVSGVGSCTVGSGTFRISFCEHAWVLNLMGAIIVPLAFLAGLFGWRNE